MLRRRLSVFVVLCLTACGSPPTTRIQGATMGTAYTITIADGLEAAEAGQIQATVEQSLRAINDSMSTYLPDSEISRINHSPSTDWQAVSPGLLKVLQTAQTISVLSDGAFDVTVAPIVELWGFGPRRAAVIPPDIRSLEQAGKSVGHQLLSIRTQPPAVRKHKPQLRLDLSAIAKGYAVDQLAAILKARQLNDYLIDIGGELYASGRNAEGKPWKIAIERPQSGSQLPARIVSLSDEAIATSGDYRNYIEVDGHRYSHTIDPRSNRPLSHATVLLSVIDEQAMRADALATALLVMGEPQGREWAEQHDVAAYFVFRRHDGSLQASWSSRFAEMADDESVGDES